MKKDWALVHAMDPTGRVDPKYSGMLVKYHVRPTSEGFWKWVLMLLPLLAIWAILVNVPNVFVLVISTVVIFPALGWCIRNANMATKRGVRQANPYSTNVLDSKSLPWKTS